MKNVFVFLILLFSSNCFSSQKINDRTYYPSVLKSNGSIELTVTEVEWPEGWGFIFCVSNVASEPLEIHEQSVVMEASVRGEKYRESIPFPFQGVLQSKQSAVCVIPFNDVLFPKGNYPLSISFRGEKDHVEDMPRVIYDDFSFPHKYYQADDSREMKYHQFSVQSDIDASYQWTLRDNTLVITLTMDNKTNQDIHTSTLFAINGDTILKGGTWTRDSVTDLLEIGLKDNNGKTLERCYRPIPFCLTLKPGKQCVSSLVIRGVKSATIDHLDIKHLVVPEGSPWNSFPPGEIQFKEQK